MLPLSRATCHVSLQIYRVSLRAYCVPHADIHASHLRYVSHDVIRCKGIYTSPFCPSSPPFSTFFPYIPTSVSALYFPSIYRLPFSFFDLISNLTIHSRSCSTTRENGTRRVCLGPKYRPISHGQSGMTRCVHPHLVSVCDV